VEGYASIHPITQRPQQKGRAIALCLMHYSYCQIYTTLRVTPAVQAGLADRVWEIAELLALLAEWPRQYA
jgi:hypothetical protein